MFKVLTFLRQDNNRYNASRGAHLNLKRAEKARILVNKIPGKYTQYFQVLETCNCFILTIFKNVYAALVDSLVAKTRVWEEEHGLTFEYDGVPLLAMLDEYALLRHEREEEKRRMKV